MNLKKLFNLNNSKKNNLENDYLFKNIQENLLWESSNLIPFFETDSSKNLFNWLENWTQNQPTCLLYGNISSGKSRIIEAAVSKFSLKTLEIDFASTKNIQQCLSEIEEASQSYFVGSIIKDQNYLDVKKPNSIIIFEHIDSLIPKLYSLPQNIIKFCSNSRVPIIMTSNFGFYQNNFTWLQLIEVNNPINILNIIKSSLWIKKTLDLSINFDQFLNFTNNDLRKTSLQLMFNNDLNNLISLQENFYLSIPNLLKTNEFEKFLIFNEYLTIFDNEEDLIFTNYLNNYQYKLFNKKRENQFLEYYEFASNKIPHQKYGNFNKIDIVTIAYISSKTSIQQTRNSKKVLLTGLHNIKSIDIEKISNWELFPYYNNLF